MPEAVGSGARPRHGRRWATLGVVVALAAIAAPVLGAGQPSLQTSDADRQAADAGALPDVEVALLDGVDAARAEHDVDVLEVHPEASRLARDWAEVMARSAETVDELAACEDLDAEPAPIWHPTDPHDDLASVYVGEIGEVVGCYTDDVTVEDFLERRVADPDHAAELLHDGWAHQGVGAVAGPDESTYLATVMTGHIDPAPDRRGITDAAAALRGRDAGSVEVTVAAGSGEMAAPLRSRALLDGQAPVLLTDRPTGTETDPLLAAHPRVALDHAAVDGAEVVVLGEPDAVSERAEAELANVGYDVWRWAARGFGADPTQPVAVPSDVAGSPHESAVAVLAEVRVLVGRSDGAYAPQSGFTRGQVATVLARSLDLPEAGGQPFPDVTGNTHADAIAAARAAGLVEGFTDGTYRAQDPVTRGQLASMLSRAFELSAPAGAEGFADVTSGPHLDAVGALSHLGVIQGFTDGTFRAGAGVTRAQAATFVVGTVLSDEVEVAR